MIKLTIYQLPSEELENTFCLKIRTNRGPLARTPFAHITDPLEMEQFKAMVWLLNKILTDPPTVHSRYSGKDQQELIEKVGSSIHLSNGLPIACLVPNSPEFISIYGQEAYAALPPHRNIFGDSYWPFLNEGSSELLMITGFSIAFYGEYGQEHGVEWEEEKHANT